VPTAKASVDPFTLGSDRCKVHLDVIINVVARWSSEGGEGQALIHAGWKRWKGLVLVVVIVMIDDDICCGDKKNSSRNFS